MQNVFGSSVAKLQLFSFFVGFLILILGWPSVSVYAQTVTVLSPSTASPVWVGASGTSPHPCNSPNISVDFNWSGFPDGTHGTWINVGGRLLTVPSVNGASGSATRTFTLSLCSLGDGLKTVTVTLANPTTRGSPANAIGVDQTPPTFSCTSALGTWSASDVGRTCTASDSGGSGLVTPGNFSLNTNVPNGAETDNAATNTTIVADNAGNTVIAGPLGGNRVDKRVPVVSFNSVVDHCSLPGNVGWCRGTQVAGFSASDAGSGLAALDGCAAGAAACTFTQSTTANGSAINIPSGLLCDMVGNCAAGIDAGPYKIDSTAPTEVLGIPDRAPDHNGWYSHAITITFSGIDAVSGIASCATTSYNGPDTVSTLMPGNCTDIAGNADVGTFAFKYDATAPMITFASRTPANANGWNNCDVTVVWNCADNFSGPGATAVNQTVSNEGQDLWTNGTCVDNAGNYASDTQRGIHIDKTPPSTSLSIGEPKISYGGTFVRGDTPFMLSCSDALSGCAETQFRIDGVVVQTGNSFNLSGLVDGVHTVEFRGADLAENVGTFTQAPMPIILDDAPPVIRITSPADGAIVERGAAVAADFFATDAGCGLAFLSGPVFRGSFIDTSAVGGHEFIVVATDRLGHRNSLTHRYQVIFLPPEVERQVQQQLQQDLQDQLNENVKKEGFRSREKIKLYFGFKDPRTGKAITDALVRASLFEVLDPAWGKLEFISFLGAFTFDATVNQYRLEFAAVDAGGKPLPADRYQIEIFFNDGMSIRLSFVLS